MGSPNGLNTDFHGLSGSNRVAFWVPSHDQELLVFVTTRIQMSAGRAEAIAPLGSIRAIRVNPCQSSEQNATPRLMVRAPSQARRAKRDPRLLARDFRDAYELTLRVPSVC